MPSWAIVRQSIGALWRLAKTNGAVLVTTLVKQGEARMVPRDDVARRH
jgi:hypothetical protein